MDSLCSVELLADNVGWEETVWTPSHNEMSSSLAHCCVAHNRQDPSQTPHSSLTSNKQSYSQTPNTSHKTLHFQLLYLRCVSTACKLQAHKTAKVTTKNPNTTFMWHANYKIERQWHIYVCYVFCKINTQYTNLDVISNYICRSLRTTHVN